MMATSVVAWEGRLAGQTADGDGGQGVLVGSTIDGSAFDLLGRDVLEGADEAARARQAGLP